MFPTKVNRGTTPADKAIQAKIIDGLPTLQRAMTEAQIDTPPRVAAFLTTIAHESGFVYDVKQHGATAVYAGRGYIQLTGSVNYKAAGAYIGVDLGTYPEFAQSLAWSAPIARWYWTVNRRINPMADALQMGKVNKAIGYPLGDGVEDSRRCASFAAALKYLTGTVPDGITCTR